MLNTEITHIFISVIALSLAFSFFDINIFPFALLTVGIGFAAHELAHKIASQKYGMRAEYRIWPAGILLMFATAFFGVIFAAPGAVYVLSPYAGRKESGVISLAGPATNFALAIIFFAFLAFAPLPHILAVLCYVGAKINLFLSFFNMIPFHPLDGAKVANWNTYLWGIFMLALFAFSLFSGIRII